MPTLTPELAAIAYAHAAAVLGPGVPAEEAAILGLRRGGRSRSSVLGHTRHEALARVASVPDLDAIEPSELVELARLLTFTRPAVERAIVDLDTRHGLDRGGLGRALGLPPAAAAARAAEVMLEWQRSLDPVVLARMGPGSCAALASLLAGGEDGEQASDESAAVDVAPPNEAAAAAGTLAQLLAAGAVVAGHAEECALCRDRLRAMVSVRTLLAQEPIGGAPAAVTEAGAHARMRSSSAPPPLDRAAAAAAGAVVVPLGGGARGSARPWRIAAAVVAAVVLVAVAAGAVVARRDDGRDAVDELTQLPPAAATLEVSPSLLESALSPPVMLHNRSSADVTWRAAADQPWVEVQPSQGRLPAGTTEQLAIALAASAPEGPVRGSVTIRADDGSIAVVRVHTTVSRPPDVATSLAGCAVTATVEDESEVAEVVLHWREPAVKAPKAPAAGAGTEHSEPMTPSGPGYTATLPPSARGHAWWVTATDALGNVARTVDASLPLDAC